MIRSWKIQRFYAIRLLRRSMYRTVLVDGSDGQPSLHFYSMKVSLTPKSAAGDFPSPSLRDHVNRDPETQYERSCHQHFNRSVHGKSKCIAAPAESRKAETQSQSPARDEPMGSRRDDQRVQKAYRHHLLGTRKCIISFFACQWTLMFAFPSTMLFKRWPQWGLPA